MTRVWWKNDSKEAVLSKTASFFILYHCGILGAGLCFRPFSPQRPYKRILFLTESNTNFAEENGMLYLDEDYELEIWRENDHVNLFEKIFNRTFSLRLFSTNQQPVSEIANLGGGK
jgi:hypothetical protein